MKKLLTTLVFAAFALVTTAIGAEFPDINIKDLKNAIEDGKVTLIDVNGSISYRKGHIPSAIDFRSTTDLATVLPKDKGALIVAYCGGPSCSAFETAASKAKKLGYTNVKHLSVGISGWLQAGESIEKEN